VNELHTFKKLQTDYSSTKVSRPLVIVALRGIIMWCCCCCSTVDGAKVPNCLVFSLSTPSSFFSLSSHFLLLPCFHFLLTFFSQGWVGTPEQAARAQNYIRIANLIAGWEKKDPINIKSAFVR